MHLYVYILHACMCCWKQTTHKITNDKLKFLKQSTINKNHKYYKPGISIYLLKVAQLIYNFFSICDLVHWFINQSSSLLILHSWNRVRVKDCVP